MKTIIITGANRGLGRETARKLAQDSQRIILACRNTAQGEAVRQEISRETGNPHLHVLYLDLENRVSIRNFVAEFARLYGHLDILINNAGISHSDKKISDDGLNPIIGPNYFGTFLLTELLQPCLVQGGKILFLTSNIYKIGRYSLAKLEQYHWFKAYAVSKLMIIHYAVYLARSHPEWFIYLIHPGVVRTGIMYSNKWYDFLIKLMLSPAFISVEQGADTTVYLANQPGRQDWSGRLFARRSIQKIPEKFLQPADMDSLYRYSLQLMQ